MRIWKVDDKEQLEAPEGITFKNDAFVGPSAPEEYPHKVEYLDTHQAVPQWTLVINNTANNYRYKLADQIHLTLCGDSHAGTFARDAECSYQHANWIRPYEARRKYLRLADDLLKAIQKSRPNGDLPEDLYRLAVEFLTAITSE